MKLNALLPTTPIVIISLCGFISCEKAEKRTPPPEKPPKVVEIKPLTEAEKVSLNNFGLRVENAVKSEDREFLTKLIDYERIGIKSVEGLDVPAGFMKGFQGGLKKGSEKAINSLLAGTLTFIELQEVDEGRPLLLFRATVNGGLEYLEYEMERDGNSEYWTVIEVYNYTLGTSVSELLRSMVMPVIVEVNRPAFLRILAQDSDSKGIELVDAMPTLQQMLQLNRSGTEEGARSSLKLYHALPEKVKDQKFPLILRLGAASNLPDLLEKDSEYFKAAETFQAKFPGDPSLALLSIDFHILAGNFEGGHKAIDDLYEKVHDPYLKFYHAYLLLHEKEYEKAEKLARAWIAKKPDDKEGWEMVLESGVGQNRFDWVAESITRLEDDFELSYQEAVLTNEVFAAFRNSNEGKQWLKRNQNREPSHHDKPANP